jgi:hypothetical protein
MRLEFFVIGITAFFVYNAYTDGKYTKMFMSFKKYYQMIFFCIIGVSIYLLLKKNPGRGRQMLLYANNVIKYMPIDKTAMNMITPIFDFTSEKEDGGSSFMESFNDIHPAKYGHQRNMLAQGNTTKATKRCVSETKKKYVAAQQDWKCGDCGDKLDHTYEIDHKIRLEYGGGNDVQNLVALCRNCHGRKTASENM